MNRIKFQQCNGWRALLGGAGFLISAISHCAWAVDWPQDQPQPPIPVYDQDRPSYDAPAIDAGSFRIDPSAWETLTYDDNIFASDRDRKNDGINTTTEAIQAVSQWSRDSLALKARSDQQRYFAHGFENANLFQIDGTGRLDISGDGFVQIEGGFSQQPESRDSPEADADATERPIFNTAGGTVSYVQRINQLEEMAQFSVSKTAYISEAEAGRSGVEWRYQDRISYYLFGSAAVFVQGGYAMQDWLRKGDERNYRSLTALLGVSAYIPGMLEMELGVGALRQHYRNPAFDTLLTPTINGHLLWNVLPLTTVTADISRTVTGTETFCDSPPAQIACQTLVGAPSTEDVSSLRSSLTLTSVDAGIQHEVWHNVLGEARFRYVRADFELGDVRDNTYSYNLNARYLLNRNLEVDASYSHNLRRSNRPDVHFYNSGPYSENVLSITLKAAV